MISRIFLLFALSLWLFASPKPTLTIYTYDSFTASWGSAPQIKEAFEKLYPCHLHFVGVESAIGALRKIQIEGKRTKADILLGIDTNIAQIAKKTGLFVPHGIETKAILPTPYRDDFFLPYDYNYLAFVYDSKKLTTVPQSLEELASMPKDFKIIIQDPRSSTVGLGLLLWVKERYGDKALAYWQRLAPHILTVTKGWSESYGLFLRGEGDMVLSYTTSPAYHISEENKTHYHTAHFKKGHYGQIEVAGILKSSPHYALAQAFLAFTQSETFADIIPTTNWSYPIITTPKGLPKAYQSLIKPSKMILRDSDTVEKERKGVIEEWLRGMQR